MMKCQVSWLCAVLLFGITPPLVKGDVTLDFESPSSVKETNGLGAYFTHRLPGTGSGLLENDAYLNLAPVPGCLTVTSTRSNLEYYAGGSQLNFQAEAPGLYMTDVANRDVSVSALIRGIHIPQVSDQFVVYLSDSSGKHVRAGAHMSPAGPQFVLSSNQGGWDAKEYFGPTGTFAEGNDILLNLSRTAGLWQLKWNNLTAGTQGSSGSYALPWLNSQATLAGGIWYANPTNDIQKTSQLDWFRAGQADAGVKLDFDPAGSIRDAGGKGASFSTRMPGTGSALPANDPNLNLAAHPGRLTVTSTRSNLEYNGGGSQLNDWAEAPGMLLTNTAQRDLKVSALIRDIHVSQESDQFVLYVSDASGKHVRAGAHVWSSGANPRQFVLSSNQGGWDAKEYFGPTGVFSDGDDVLLNLTRTAGLWQLNWENQTAGTSGSSDTYALPWLDSQQDLYAGIWYANPTNDNPKTSQLESFSVDVVPEPASLALLGMGAVSLLAYAWRRRRSGTTKESIPER